MLQPFVKAIQYQSVLDRAADPLQPPLKQAFRGQSGQGRALKNFLSGTWIGHPLHPIVKDIPIGAWTMAALFDGIDALEQTDSLKRAADICVAAGLAGALASAITGLSDWSDTYGRARRIGVAHAVLNVSASACYTASLVARRSNRGMGTKLGLCGYGIMLLGAYLGGHLVFSEQIGVNHAVRQSLPTEFLTVMRESELLENQPKRVDYKGIPVVLIRRGAAIFALYEKCSHMGGPLAKGSLEGSSIRCPWHGSRFALQDGRVLEGPATNAQPCFETRVVAGEIQIRSAQPESP
jgi:nitrite reductase/ring-hydroxylating ferredoxin subunit/uncharacterized membrane protein